MTKTVVVMVLFSLLLAGCQGGNGGSSGGGNPNTPVSGGGGSDNPSNEDDDNSKPCDESLTRVYLELRNTIAINRDYSTGIRSRTVLHAALLYELLEKYHVITANQENSQLIVKHYESLFNTTGRLRGEPRFKVCSFERI